MKKLLLLICLCLCTLIVDAQRILNWKISFDSENLIDLYEIKVTVNKTDTCSLIESIFFPSDMYSKTVENESNIYKTKWDLFILDNLNLFTENGWSVDDIFYEGTISGTCKIDISLISSDGSPENFFNSIINKKRTYMLGVSTDDNRLDVYPSFVSKVHIRYMKLLEKQYDKDNNIYVFEYPIMNNIHLLYISDWRIDFLKFCFPDGNKTNYFFLSHELEGPKE